MKTECRFWHWKEINHWTECSEHCSADRTLPSAAGFCCIIWLPESIRWGASSLIHSRRPKMDRWSGNSSFAYCENTKTQKEKVFLYCGSRDDYCGNNASYEIVMSYCTLTLFTKTGCGVGLSKLLRFLGHLHNSVEVCRFAVVCQCYLKMITVMTWFIRKQHRLLTTWRVMWCCHWIL